jgi:integrase/recombinase XerD
MIVQRRYNMELSSTKFISEKEETRLFKAMAKANDNGAIVDLMLFQLLSLTGLRISEALALTWADIGEDYIKLKEQKNGTKNGTILIGNRLKTLLGEFSTSNPYKDLPHLFNTTRGQYKRTNAHERLKHWLRVAGLRESISCHSFRHSYATKALNNGLELPFVKSQLRHANIATTSAYLHFTQASKDKIKDIF